MVNEEYLENRYIKTKNKYRKIVSYKSGENKLRQRHEEIAKYLSENIDMSIFSKAYVEKSSIIKNARCHMYNDIFILFDVKDFFPSINHDYLAKQIYKYLARKVDVTLSSCYKLVEICSCSSKGLPLGLVTSPVLSNIYMKEFDNILYGRLKGFQLDNIIYTRYADDIYISYKAKEIDEKVFESIKEEVDCQLKRIGLRSNKKKEKVINISSGGHVKVTGISIIVDEKNYRRLSVGRKKKDQLFNDAISYVTKLKTNNEEALRIKGYEAFVLSVEGKRYEECYSINMKNLCKQMGYSSLHDLIHNMM